MMIRIAFLTLATFSFTIVLSQKSKNALQIEKTVAAIDSIIKTGDSIGLYVHPLFSDDGGEVFLRHLYTIDTAKRFLHKAVYEYVNFDHTTFYYSNQRIIKVIVIDTSLNTKPYKCEYYFDNDSIFSVKEQGIPSPKNSWNKKTITSQAKLYLEQFSSICDMLDKRK
jgi:hypothetical protein